MTKEEKAIADQVAANEAAKETESATTETTEETTTDTDSTDADAGDDSVDDGADSSDKSGIDYDAELKKERDARAKAEQAAADASFKLRDKKRKEKEGDDEEVDSNDDKPLTAKDLRGILAQERQATRKEFQGDLIRKKAMELAGPKASASEIELIIERHRNRSFPEDLPLDEQLEEVYVGIHRKKILGTSAELKRALRSKDTTERTVSSTHRESQPGSEPKLAAQDLSAIKAAGYVWDGKSRFFTKKLAGGKKTLFYDPKNKKRWIQ